MKKLWFVGAQGTGKTTVLNYFKNRNLKVITEVVRNLSKKGIKINEMGDTEGQEAIFSKYEELFAKYNAYVSDRGLIDVAAYTSYHVKQGKVSQEFYEDELNRIKKFFKNNKDVLVCYFPIEFDVVDDGVRSTDEEYRKFVDEHIKQILDDLKIPYITIHGKVLERVEMINKSAGLES